MADTSYIKKVIEPYVQEWMAMELGSPPLAEKELPLISGGSYRFDAVDPKSEIVGAILSNRAITVNGNENTGGVRKALNDVQSLWLLPNDPDRYMVFTNPDFCDLIKRRSRRFRGGEIRWLICPLPLELQKGLDDVLDKASKEQIKGFRSDA